MGERLEDIFQDKIAKEFPGIVDFKKFARSKYGLCLEDHEIQTIVDNNPDVEEQKLRMLAKWRAIKGKEATVPAIIYLVERFRIGDSPTNYVNLPGGIFGAFRDKPLCERNHVFLGEQKSDVTGHLPRAVKIINYDETNKKEAITLSKLGQHENVVSTYHAGIYEEGLMSKYIFIVMELCDKKNLSKFLAECRENDDEFVEDERWKMVIQLMRALAFIHENNVVHRDLKPHNILFSQDKKSVKLVDFGLSKNLIHGSTTQISRANVGTDGYRAPETYNKNVISKKSDIYSAGITVAEILSNGRHPFGDDVDLLNYNIKTNQPPDLEQLLVLNKADAKNLILPMLDFDPDNRPTAEEVLNDPILQQQINQNAKNAIQNKGAKSLENVETVEIAENTNAIIAYHVYNMHMYYYKPSTEEWTQMPQELEPQEFSTVAVKEHIYALKDKEVHRLKYRDKTARWRRKADMLEDHGTCPSAAVLNDQIYVCTRGNMIPVNYAEKYDCALDQWTKIIPMSVPRKRPGVGASEDALYCVGGWGDNNIKISAVERYIEKEDKWETIANSPRPTFKSSVVELNGILYVADDIGIQCYNINEATWRELHLDWPLRVEYTSKILTVNEKLYLIGYIHDLQQRMYLLDPEKEELILVDKLVDIEILVNACVAVFI